MASSYHTSSLPPPGVTPNFDHPQSRTREAYIGIGVCLAVATVVVVLRIYIKLAFIAHMWGWDDCKSLEMNLSSY